MRAMVIGAGGAVGEAAVRALMASGWHVRASMRQHRADVAARLVACGADVNFETLPDEESWLGPATETEALVFITNLITTRAALERLPAPPRRLVVFSSNNVAVDVDAPSYRALAEAEASLRAQYQNIAIIRPTLIYGDARLITVTRLLNMARHAPAMLLPGSGRARVQPVFHADLGALAAGLAAPDAPRGVFAAGGPEVVTMGAFYAAAARAAGVQKPIVCVPRWALGPAVAAGVLSREQAARADADRAAVPQDALPASLALCTSLGEGLAAHFTSLLGGSPDGA